VALKKAILTVNPLFKLLLIINCVVFVTTSTIMVIIALVSSEKMTNAQDRLFHVCEFAFTTTTGAFVGLLGGRAASPDTNNMTAGLAAAAELKKTAPRQRREAKAGPPDDLEEPIESREE